MNRNDLEKLGRVITDLRIAKNLKQSELAYEAGISERTLQRLEAGDVVKSDGLLKVIAYLGKLDDLMNAISPPELSPYELASRPGKGQTRRSRVRNSGKKGEHQIGNTGEANSHGNVVWPEDKT